MAGIDAGLISLFIGPKLVSGFAEKLGKSVDGQLTPVADKISRKFSARLSAGLDKAGRGMTVGVTGPLLAVGGAALAAALTVDDALDKIRIGTGTTGDALASLEGSFKAVAQGTPGDLAGIADTITILNQRLGLSGKPLEDLTTAFVNLQQVTGEAVDANAVTRAISAFSIPADEATGALERLFRISQDSGVNFNTLTGQLVTQSAAFAELGFGINETATLIAQAESTGVNTGTLLAGLRANIIKSAAGGGADLEKAMKDQHAAEEEIYKLGLKRETQLAKLRELEGQGGAKATSAQADLAAAQARFDAAVGTGDAAGAASAKAAVTKAQLAYNAALKAGGPASASYVSAANALKGTEYDLAAAQTTLAASQAAIGKAQAGGAANPADAASFFKESVKAIQGALAAGDDSQAQALAKGTFGARTFLDVLDAIKRGTFDLDTALAKTASGDSLAGLAKETADFPEKLSQLKNLLTTEFADLGAPLVQALTDALTAILPAVRDLAGAFAGLSPETKKTIVVFAGIVAAVGPILIVVSKIVTAFQIVKTAWIGLNLAFLTSPIGLVIAGIVLAVALIIMNWDKIKPYFDQLLGWLSDAFGTFVDWLSSAWESIVSVATTAWTGLMTVVQPVIDFIIGYVKLYLKIWTTVFNVAKTVALAVWDALKAAASLVINLVIGYVKLWLTVWLTVFNVAKAIAGAVWDAVQAGAAKLADFLRPLFEKIGETISAVWGIVRTGFEKVSGFITSTAQAFVDTIAGPFERVGEAISSVWTGIKDGASAAWEFITGLFDEVIAKAGEVIQTVKDIPGVGQLIDAASAAAGTVNGLFGGGRAAGGPVRAGMPYLVGELGPEIVIPRTAGTVVPNSLLGGGSPATYNVNVHNPVAEPASTSIPSALRRANNLRVSS